MDKPTLQDEKQFQIKILIMAMDGSVASSIKELRVNDKDTAWCDFFHSTPELSLAPQPKVSLRILSALVALNGLKSAPYLLRVWAENENQKKMEVCANSIQKDSWCGNFQRLFEKHFDIAPNGKLQFHFAPELPDCNGIIELRGLLRHPMKREEVSVP